jgi:hypothetical protein
LARGPRRSIRSELAIKVKGEEVLMRILGKLVEGLFRMILYVTLLFFSERIGHS